MNEGAIAIIDCLGFKGIRQRASIEEVLEDFKKIKADAEWATGDGLFAAR